MYKLKNWIFLQVRVRGTPCKCCGRPQQRSSPGLWLRLTAVLKWSCLNAYGEYNIISSLLSLFLIYDKNTFHTPVVAEVAGPRDTSSSSHSQISKRYLATALRVSSSITTGHYLLNKGVHSKRLGSDNNAMKDTQQAYT